MSFADICGDLDNRDFLLSDYIALVEETGRLIVHSESDVGSKCATMVAKLNLSTSKWLSVMKRRWFYARRCSW